MNRILRTPELQLTTPLTRRSNKPRQTPPSVPTPSTSDGDKSPPPILEDTFVGKAIPPPTIVTDRKSVPLKIPPGQKGDQQDGAVVEPIPSLGRRRNGGPTRSNTIPVPRQPSNPAPQKVNPLSNWFRELGEQTSAAENSSSRKTIFD